MEVFNFSISHEELTELYERYPLKGKNSDIGKIAVEIVKLYFSQIDSTVIFVKGSNGSDLGVTIENRTSYYEIKGTEDENIAFNKLKVSGMLSYNSLINGMVLIRVTNIGKMQMKLYFMKYGEDFNLVQEPRWSIKKIN